MSVGKTMGQRRGSRGLLMGVPFAVMALFFAAVPASADDPPADIPTFSKDIAPILQASCQQCHQETGMAPMSLVTFDEVRPWAPVIKERVVNREMPPWHLDRTVGVQEYENDPSLTDEQIDLVARWVDGGAPEGDPADLPPPVAAIVPGGAWQLQARLGRPPDLIIRSDPFTLEANGMDQWWRPRVAFEGFDEEKWIMAAEFKPAFPLGQKVVHHGHANLVQEGQGTRGVARYGVGKTWEIFPEDVGMRIAPGGGTISWDLHYWPTGVRVEDDVVEAGLWFYPTDAPPTRETRGEVMILVDRSEERPRGVDIIIPPHGYQTLQGVHVLQQPTVLHSFRPHAHMRGKEMSMEAIYPDGRREMLSKVDRYDHFWQLAYQYAEQSRPILPRGTVLLFTTVFDNTTNNPINPDPDQWVTFGQRGVDEMSHAWVGMTYLDDASYEQLLAEREAQRRLASVIDDD
ncbi:MAG: cytochrome c [Gemmatimonadota bacterium]